MRKLNKGDKKIFFNLTFLLFLAVLVTALIFSSLESTSPGGYYGNIAVSSNEYTADSSSCYINGNPAQMGTYCEGSTIMRCTAEVEWFFFTYAWEKQYCTEGCQQVNEVTALCTA